MLPTEIRYGHSSPDSPHLCLAEYVELQKLTIIDAFSLARKKLPVSALSQTKMYTKGGLKLHQFRVREEVDTSILPSWTGLWTVESVKSEWLIQIIRSVWIICASCTKPVVTLT